MEKLNEQIEMKKNLSGIEKTLFEKHAYSKKDLIEIMPKLKEINRLRKEKNAVILAHYYQTPSIQLIANITGDSLKLAQATKEIGDKEIIVSSTVKFMGEMIKLLSPDKKVVLPVKDAGCSIAEGINGNVVRRIRNEFPNAGIVSYINTYADTKAEVDSICTSANAKEVIRKIEGNPVIMIPDYFFSKNIINDLIKGHNDGRDYIIYKGHNNKEIILESVINKKEYLIDAKGISLPKLKKGTCIVHEQFSVDEIKWLKKKYDVEIVMAHPEVIPEVAKVSDIVGGTGKMLSYVKENPDIKKFMVITECDLTAPLRERYPDREFITPCKLCPYMKKNSLDDVLNSLKNEVYEIDLDERTSERAKKSLEKMFKLTGGDYKK